MGRGATGLQGEEDRGGGCGFPTRAGPGPGGAGRGWRVCPVWPVWPASGTGWGNR